MPNTQQPISDQKQVKLSEIFLVFLRIGAFSFGGGLTGWVYREVVQERRWLAEQEFLSGMAVSQILPGANVTNLSIYIGQKLRGTIGAFAALIGLLLVPFFLVIGFLLVYENVSQVSWVGLATDGVAAAAVGLLMLTTWRTGTQSGRSAPGAIVIVATFVAVGLLQLPLLPSVLCIAPLSIAAAWKRGKNDAN
ncbi:MAG TPA: chromate transporter [Dongiaceae bacterium]|nr:chromate transporter [Dongiaceae bacterium]